MPTHLEADAGIEFNFNILTNTKSKNITISKASFKWCFILKSINRSIEI